MPRYIDADAFEKRIEEERTYLLNRGQTWAENILVKHLLDILYAQPKADVVEVVRCRECCHRGHCRTANVWAVSPPDDWFCADGERKEDEEIH